MMVVTGVGVTGWRHTTKTGVWLEVVMGQFCDTLLHYLKQSTAVHHSEGSTGVARKWGRDGGEAGVVEAVKRVNDN